MQEFWKVVHELQVMYQVSRFDAIEICVSEFSALNLNLEKKGTLKNVALFRVACWKTGEITQMRKKRQNLKETWRGKLILK